MYSLVFRLYAVLILLLLADGLYSQIVFLQNDRTSGASGADICSVQSVFLSFHYEREFKLSTSIGISNKFKCKSLGVVSKPVTHLDSAVFSHWRLSLRSRAIDHPCGTFAAVSRCCSRFHKHVLQWLQNILDVIKQRNRLRTQRYCTSRHKTGKPIINRNCLRICLLRSSLP